MSYIALPNQNILRRQNNFAQIFPNHISAHFMQMPKYNQDLIKKLFVCAFVCVCDFFALNAAEMQTLTCE